MQFKSQFTWNILVLEKTILHFIASFNQFIKPSFISWNNYLQMTKYEPMHQHHFTLFCVVCVYNISQEGEETTRSWSSSHFPCLCWTGQWSRRSSGHQWQCTELDSVPPSRGDWAILIWWGKEDQIHIRKGWEHREKD